MSYMKRLYEEKHYKKVRTGRPFLQFRSPLSPRKSNGTRSKTLSKIQKSDT